MESAPILQHPEQVILLLMFILLFGVVVGVGLTIAVYKELVAPPDELVREELATMRSTQRLAAAASRTRQAMRREQAAVRDELYDEDDFDGWETSHER